jgi:regulator of replication initiation timing
LIYPEYISTLEEQVKDSDNRNKELQTKNRALQQENNKLKAELKRLRQKYGEPETTGADSDNETVPPITPPSSNHSTTDDNYSPNSLISSSSSFSPQQAADILDLDFMDLYASADATPNTFASFISQAVMPNWDVPTVLKGKPSDGTVAITNATRNPMALLQDYPLLAPALLSIVVNHTFNMNYLAFSSGNFPYNEPLPAYQENGTVVADVKRSPSLSPGLDGLSPDELDLLWDVLNKRYQTAVDCPDGPTKEEELRHLAAIREKLSKERKFRQVREFFWNTLWRLQGLDDESIQEKYRECFECYMKKETQRKLKLEKKAAKESCSGDCSPKRTHLTWSEKKQKLASFKVRIIQKI